MPAPNLEVLAIGTAAYDFTVFIEEFPRENTKSEVRDMIEGGGGPAANAAYLLSLWGARCGFAGVLGDDVYGERIRCEFAGVGTDLALTETRSGHSTPVSFILVNNRTGSRTIVNRTAPQHGMEVTPAQMAGLSPRVLVFDGHQRQPCHAALAAFPHAQSILDAGSLRPGTRELAGQVDFLLASERFALQASGLEALSGEEERKECLSRLRGMAREGAAIVVTLGERGLVYEDAGVCRHVPAYPARAADTTGAGDVFHGAFAYGVLRAWPLELNLKVASLAAALSVRERGGRRSIPPLAAVRKEFQHVEGRDLPGF